ncbi:MAG: hypothetical protein IPG60_02845 [Bacteroidetes bacterium]|nr:hypothetical protein [Bacteroidota bacterium]
MDADTATIYYMQGLKPYSTSGKGKNTLFDINECHDSLGFPIEIVSLDTMINIPECDSIVGANLCLTAPAYSMGYFKVPIQSHSYPPGGAKVVAKSQNKLIIYPNPSSNSFYFFTTHPRNLKRLIGILKYQLFPEFLLKKLVLHHFCP